MLASLRTKQAAALTPFVLLLLLAVCAPVTAQTRWPSVNEHHSAATARLYKALDQPTTLEFIETPLQDVVEYLKDLHDIEIQIDNHHLEETGLGPDPEKPVTRNLKGITLRSALNLILRELELTYLVKDEVLLITSPAMAVKSPVMRTYDVSTLLGDNGDAAELAGLLSKLVPSTAETRVGGDVHGGVLIVPATHMIVPYKQLIIVNTDEGNQTRISRLLATLVHGQGK